MYSIPLFVNYVLKVTCKCYIFIVPYFIHPAPHLHPTKEWERAKAKAEEDKRKQLEEEKRINDEIKATQHRLFMAASLPPEPPTPKTPAAEAFLSTPNGVDGITTLRFRLPPQCSNDPNVKHSTMIRRFAGSDILKHVFMFMESKGYSKSDYKLFTTYPIRDVSVCSAIVFFNVLNCDGCCCRQPNRFSCFITSNYVE